MRKIAVILIALVASATLFADVYVQALPGKFTINANGDQVRFSPSNLQYVGTWQFAMNQWESFGTSQSDDHRDLFGWGTGDAPNKVSTDNADYPAYTEWGTNEISNVVNEANSWRTLTNDEWHFLLFKRTNADDLCKMGSIDGVNGAILYPDGWSLSTTQTILSSEEWSVIEAKGACFLPVTGRRKGSSVERLDVGSYWTSELYEDPDAYCIGFTAGVGFSGFITFNDKYIGQAVRLVQDVEAVSTTTLSDAITAAIDYYNEIKDIEGAATIAAMLLYYIKEAQAVLDNPDASQEAVNAAADRLNAAVEQAKYDMETLSGIEDVMYRDSSKLQKVLMDGHLYIILNGKVYNATGAEVK